MTDVSTQKPSFTHLARAALLCAGLAIAPFSAATAAKLLQPDSNWTVSRIAARTAEGDSYCALARRFQSGVVLTLARNADGESSLAVDFQADKLSTGEATTVTLNPGGGQGRTFAVTPVSAQALVVRLGKDDAFHKALDSSGQLSLGFSGEAYSFAVSDMSRGRQDMDACIDALPAGGSVQKPQIAQAPQKPVPAPVAATPVAPAGVPKPVIERVAAAPSELVLPPVSSLPAPLPQNNAEIQALEEENLRLRNALTRERRAYEDRLMEQGRSGSIMAELEEKVRLLEIENTGLQDRLASATTTAASAPLPAPIACPVLPQNPPELASLRNENEHLSSEIRSRNAQVSVLEDQIARLQATPQTDPQIIASLQAENTRLNGEIGSRSAQISQLQGQIEALQVAPRANPQELTALQTENSRLTREIQSQATQISQLNGQIVALQATPQTDPQALTALQTENARLMREMQTQTAQVAQLQGQIAALQNAPPQRDAETDAALAALRIKAGSLEAENIQLRQNASQDTGIAVQIRAENEELKAQLADQTARMAALEQRATTAEQSARQAAIAPRAPNPETQTIIASLRSKADRLEAENQRLQQDLAQKVAMQEAAAPSMPPEEKLMILSRVRSLETELQGVKAERDSLRGKIEAVHQGKGEELLHFAGGEWDLEQATRRYNEAEREIRHLGTQLEQARMSCSREKQEMEYMLFDPEIATQAQISRLTTLEEKLASSTAALNARKVEQQQALVKLEENLKTKNAEMTRARSVIQNLETEIAALRQNAAAFNPAQLAAAEEERDRLALRVSHLEKNLIDDRQNLAAARHKIAMLETGKSTTLAQAATPQISQEREEIIWMAQQSGVMPPPASGVAANSQMADKTPQTILASGQQTQEVSFPEPAAGSSEPVTPAARPYRGLPAPGALVSANPSAETPVTDPRPAERAPPPPVQKIAETPRQADPAQSEKQELQPAVKAAPAPQVVSVDTGLEDIQNVLRNADIDLVRKVDVLASEPGFSAYGWETGSLFGSAERWTAQEKDPDAFERRMSAYLRKTESRCEGDFAAVPGHASLSGETKAAAYEIACVGGPAESSAALLFYSEGDAFTVIAHETGVADMDRAMDVRDRLSSLFLGTRTASLSHF